ncbi:MAG: hypothetical protein N2511_02570 [Thermodesulfovibrionales bacterium]|nr:hypothetical protein [Thermodesulfovibrionales bacterium]
MNEHIKAGKAKTTQLELKSSIFGALIGFIDDLISNSFVGPSFLSKSLIGFFGALFFGSNFFKWTAILGVIVVSLFTLLDGLIQIVLRIIISDIKFNSTNLLLMILLQIIVNSPFGILFKHHKYL